MNICKFCGKKFRPSKPDSNFCSHACANKSRTNPSKKSIFICGWCGKEFEEWTYRNSSFCSNQCRSEFAAKQPKPHKHPKIRVRHVCLTCGKSFIVEENQIRLRGGGKYCSRICQGVAKSKTFSKEGNPNFKGGISQDSKYYRGSNWKTQKRRAMKRDNYECQVCGKRRNEVGFFGLGVHHIIPYRHFKGNLEAANQLENLITLCRKHHALIEWGKIACPYPK